MKPLPKEELEHFDSRRIVHPVMNEKNFRYELEVCYCHPQLTGNDHGLLLCRYLKNSQPGNRRRLEL
jgi:hypothetical protein